jgi:DNA invertase Pin-like site-specific DNA recombinase
MADSNSKTLRAALYARKSSDDSDKNEENKSVTRQIEHARKFCAQKGWQAIAEFSDDGITGGEEGFKKRAGLKAMLGRLKEFDVIVMSELSRLGRHQVLTSTALHQIEKAGVQVWFYLDGKQCKFDTSIDRFLVSAIAFAGELEREAAGQRSRDALMRKAAKGFSPGGVCYGYDLVPVYGKGVNGERTRTHTDYAINEAQAETIRGIFRAYADGGLGLTTLAKLLNGSPQSGPRAGRLDLAAARRRFFPNGIAPAPKQGKRGTGSWSPSAVREILMRQRYRGIVPFGDIKTMRPDLRIVPEDLWKRVEQRLREVGATYVREDGRLWGRPSSEKYLLSGMGHCSCCGKNIAVLYRSADRMRYYGCSYNYVRHACTNDHRARMDDLDRSVIAAIESQVLTPTAIAYTVEQAAELVQRELKRNPERPKQLEAEARKLRTELERFLALIAEGKPPQSVLVEIKRREQRLEEIDRELKSLTQAPRAIDLKEIRRLCEARLGKFQDLLRGNVPVARQALRKLLPEPLRMAPVTVDGRRTLGFEGRTVLGPLLAPVHISLGSPT